MEIKEFTAKTDDDSRRLDRVLRKLLCTKNLPMLYCALRKGLVKVNGKKASPDTRIKVGDTITIATFLLEQERKHNTVDVASNIYIEDIFCNEHIRVINKPYNICVHGNKNALDPVIKKQYARTNQKSLSFTPGALHRLDRYTSGALVFSQSLIGAKWFSANLQNHNIAKTYIAILQGKLTQAFHYEDYLQKAQNTNTSFVTMQVVEKNTPLSELAITTLYPLAWGKVASYDATLVKVEIATGRQHQIRVQSAYHGHGLLGDTAYNNVALPPSYRKLYLHAYSLHLPPNDLGIPCNIFCKPSSDFLQILQDNFASFSFDFTKKI